MRVDGTTGLLRALLAAQTARTATTASAETPAPLPPPGNQPGSASQASPSVAMLVTIAAVAPEEQRRNAALADAGRGLDQLHALRLALVRGAVPAERLHALRDWARRRAQPDDADLAALLDELELRILVELAKRER